MQGDGSDHQRDVGASRCAFDRLDMRMRQAPIHVLHHRHTGQKGANGEDAEHPRCIAGRHRLHGRNEEREETGGEHHAAGQTEHRCHQAFGRATEKEDGDGAQTGGKAGEQAGLKALGSHRMSREPMEGLLDAEGCCHDCHDEANPQVAAGVWLGVVLDDDLGHGGSPCSQEALYDRLFYSANRLIESLRLLMAINPSAPPRPAWGSASAECRADERPPESRADRR